MMLVVLTACTSIDCPLNNLVKVNLIMKNGNETLSDTITITAIRTSSDTIFNRGVNISSLAVPVSYTQEEDLLQITLNDTLGNTYKDTLTIRKTNQIHFEAVDCPPNYFHTLTGITTTCHAIDSVVIKNPNIDYDSSKENIYIYFTPRD
ncbi:MAG: alpha amylase [Prevotella sp.]|nr:alpha amylase [Prevotella sp.]